MTNYQFGNDDINFMWPTEFCEVRNFSSDFTCFGAPNDFQCPLQII